MPNITDVATLAGVSRQTVSRVLNDENTVRPATRERVDAAIAELNYRPSAAARALVTRRSRTVGLVTTGGPLYGPTSTMLAFSEAARRVGYRVTMASMASDDQGAILDTIDALLAQRVEALVLIAADYAALDAVAGLDAGVPLIAAESSGRPGFHSVSVDQFEGARAATRHLLELGHRGILHLAGPARSVDAGERERGWREELAAAGVAALPVEVGDWSPTSGYLVGERLVGSGRISSGEVTAVFSSNDQMAIGMLHALADGGVEVPGQVSVVGFDDIPEAEHLVPPLTTVRQDFARLGERMVEALLAVLSDPSPTAPAHTPAVLQARASTGPAAVIDS